MQLIYFTCYLPQVDHSCGLWQSLFSTSKCYRYLPSLFLLCSCRHALQWGRKWTPWLCRQSRHWVWQPSPGSHYCDCLTRRKASRNSLKSIFPSLLKSMLRTKSLMPSSVISMFMWELNSFQVWWNSSNEMRPVEKEGTATSAQGHRRHCCQSVTAQHARRDPCSALIFCPTPANCLPWRKEKKHS